MVNFFGTYSRTLDEKGRLLLPAKLAAGKIKRLYVLKGFEGCLSVYLQDEFEKLMQNLQSLDYGDPEKRAYIRLASASVNELEVDSHGRILLGRSLLKDYGLSNDVTIIGVLDHLEIWDPTAYAKYQLAGSASYDYAAKKGN